jgi:hypothetical protein
MNFIELSKPVEAFDFRSFESVPTGRWQAGISRMLFGKYRVGISLKDSHTYTVSYWGGETDLAALLCGFLLGICFWLPEEISPQELSMVFPIQDDKDLSADFFNQLFKASDLVRTAHVAEFRKIGDDDKKI